LSLRQNAWISKKDPKWSEMAQNDSKWSATVS
jgi:hypothetical protein